MIQGGGMHGEGGAEVNLYQTQGRRFLSNCKRGELAKDMELL